MENVEIAEKFHPLGTKTLAMFILKRSSILFFMTIIFIGMMFGINYVPSDYMDIALNGMMIYAVAFIIAVVLVFFVGWLRYWRYWIFIDEKDLKIASGFISTEEIGIPYRRIKDIKIERSFLDQILGLGNVIIKVLGSQEQQEDEESTMILPSVEQSIALHIQDVVLKRAQVEQVSVLTRNNLQ